MVSYVWPIALAIMSNVVYQICAKAVPSGMNPLASLTITYAVSAITSLVLFFVLFRDANLIYEYGKTNWAPIVFGVVLVGLEVGFVYAYKAGWPVSLAPLVANSFLTIVLIFVGYLLYQESITLTKLMGAAICMVGLFLINYSK